MTHRRVWLTTVEDVSAPNSFAGWKYTTDGGGDGTLIGTYEQPFVWSLCGDNDDDADNLGYPARFYLGEDFDLAVASMDYTADDLALSDGAAFTHKAWRSHETVLKVHVDGDSVTEVDEGVSALTSWLHSKIGVPCTLKLFGTGSWSSYSVDFDFSHSLFIRVARSDNTVRYLPCSIQVERVTVPDAHTSRRTMYLRVRADKPYWWGDTLDAADSNFTSAGDTNHDMTALTVTGDLPAPVMYQLWQLDDPSWGTALKITNNETGQFLLFDAIGSAYGEIEINTNPANPYVIGNWSSTRTSIWHNLEPSSGWWDTGGTDITVYEPGNDSVENRFAMFAPRWYWTW